MSDLALDEKIAKIQMQYAHWNRVSSQQLQESVIPTTNSASTDCSDIGSDCHGDGECGGDGD